MGREFAKTQFILRLTQPLPKGGVPESMFLQHLIAHKTMEPAVFGRITY